MSVTRRTGARHAFRVASLAVLVWCLGLAEPDGPRPAYAQDSAAQDSAAQDSAAQDGAAQDGGADDTLSADERMRQLEQSIEAQQRRLLDQERVLFEQDQQLRQQFQTLQNQADVIEGQQDLIDEQRDELLRVRTQLRTSTPPPAAPPQRVEGTVPRTPPPETGVRSPQELERAEALRRARVEQLRRRLEQQRQQQQQQQAGQAAGAAAGAAGAAQARPAQGVQPAQPDSRAAEIARERARREAELYRQRLQQQQQQQQQAGQAGQPGQPGQAVAPASDPAAIDNQPTATRPRTDRPPDVEALPARAGVLTPKGNVALDLSYTYVYSDVNRVEVAGFSVLPAVLIGSFDIIEIDRQNNTFSVTGRYGLTDRIEVEARVPFIQRTDDTTGRPVGEEANDDQFSTLAGSGIGDMELGLRYQLNGGQRGWPFFIYNLRARAPTGRSPFDIELSDSGLPQELSTGSGFWSLTPGISMVYPTDPGVFFGSISYTYNFRKRFEEAGTIKPGDTLSASLGLGFSINPKVSFSVGTDYSITYRTRQNSTPVLGSTPLYAGRLSLSYSYRFTPKVSATFSVAPGFTSDAPDLTMGLRVPIRF